jgi:hypothetical protein
LTAVARRQCIGNTRDAFASVQRCVGTTHVGSGPARVNQRQAAFVLGDAIEAR